MSNTKQNDTDFKNEITVQRRAWIDRAVRGAIEQSDEGESRTPACDKERKPKLYLVGSKNNDK